jgi:hypothetical protein
MFFNIEGCMSGSSSRLIKSVLLFRVLDISLVLLPKRARAPAVPKLAVPTAALYKLGSVLRLAIELKP